MLGARGPPGPGILLGAPVVVGAAAGGGTAPCAPGACKPAPMDDASKNKVQDAGKIFFSLFYTFVVTFYI